MLISRLFKRPPASAGFFAQVDADGKCLALWALDHCPDTGQWVPVNALNPLWLGHPLPRDALTDLPAPAHKPRLRIQQWLSLWRPRP